MGRTLASLSVMLTLCRTFSFRDPGPTLIPRAFSITKLMAASPLRTITDDIVDGYDTIGSMSLSYDNGSHTKHGYNYGSDDTRAFVLKPGEHLVRISGVTCSGKTAELKLHTSFGRTKTVRRKSSFRDPESFSFELGGKPVFPTLD